MSSRGRFCLPSSPLSAPFRPPPLPGARGGVAWQPAPGLALASSIPRSRPFPSWASRPPPGASSHFCARRRELGSAAVPGGSGKAAAKCFRLTWHRRFGEIVVGLRAAETPGPLASVLVEGKSCGFGLKLRERWVPLSVHTQLQNWDHVFEKWPSRADRMFEVRRIQKGIKNSSTFFLQCPKLGDVRVGDTHT